MEKILDLSLNDQREELDYENERFPFREYIDNYDHFPEQCFPAHWHPEFELHLILRGSIEFRVEGNSVQLKSGQVIYIAPNSIHTARALTENSLSYNIIILPDLLTGFLQSINRVQDSRPLNTLKPDYFIVDPDAKEGYNIAESLRKLYYSNTNDYQELFLFENLLAIWRNLLLVFPKQVMTVEDPHAALQSERMKAMIDFIHQNYMQSITINEIAESSNISKSECFRCFSTLSEMTPMEYLNNYRLMQACKLLLNTNDSMTDICFQTGFNNTSYFAKKFKTQYGMTPKEYRTNNLVAF
ncbi:MAG: AraC family transcriptional regulator [Eubacterium sp.]|nr:AraC family transcriptional regulator [Eubacterium sp.]